jgi:hypothetical protein
MSCGSLRFATDKWIGTALIVVSATLVGCGPSPEDQAATAAAETAAAATSTPTITPTATYTPTLAPTSTSTPIPYDLSVLVTGAEEAPLVGATVGLAEAGQEAIIQTTNDDGQAFWNDLLGDPVNLSISAPGYFPLVITESIERGINEVAIALERDPHALLPSEACAPGERLLYIEDFQDGEAQGWDAIEFRAQKWDVAPHPDSPGNVVALRPGATGWSEAELRDYPLHNAVWRVRFSNHGRVLIELRWQNSGGYEVDGGNVDTSYYGFEFNAPHDFILVQRIQDPISNVYLLLVDRTLRRDVWHTAEISTYKGLMEIWLDGYRHLTYQDPKSLPGSTLKLYVGESPDAESVAYFDDISICELSAPFVPMPTPEP